MKIKFNVIGSENPWNLIENEKNNLENIDNESQTSYEEKIRLKPCSLGLTLFIVFISTVVSFCTLYFIWEMTKQPFQEIGAFRIQIYNSKYEVRVSWSNCGTLQYGKLNALSVEPSPISLNQNMTVSLDADVFQDLDEPLTIKLTVKKKIWFKMLKLPCIDNFGSCTYENICQYSPYPRNSSCILPLPNSYLPCNCPVHKGNYFADKTVVQLVDPMKYIPKWLKYGTYSVEAKGYSGDVNVGCYKFQFSVSWLLRF